MLADNRCCAPPAFSGKRMAIATRRASPSAAASSTCSQTTTNSSPPRRVTVSAGRTTDRSRELDEHGIARRVPVRVVDLLEVVEVDEDHARVAALADRPGDRLLEPVA